MAVPLTHVACCVLLLPPPRRGREVEDAALVCVRARLCWFSAHLPSRVELPAWNNNTAETPETLNRYIVSSRMGTEPAPLSGPDDNNTTTRAQPCLACGPQDEGGALLAKRAPSRGARRRGGGGAGARLEPAWSPAGAALSGSGGRGGGADAGLECQAPGHAGGMGLRPDGWQGALRTQRGGPPKGLPTNTFLGSDLHRSRLLLPLSV